MEKVPADTAQALIAEVPTPARSEATRTPTKALHKDSDISTPLTDTTVDSCRLSDGSTGDMSPGTPGAATPGDLSLVYLQRMEHGDADAAVEARDVLAVVGDEQRVYWESFFVNMPMFCGYAALFGLQHEIKSKFAISDDDVSASRQFGVAVSFLYIFNLIFRFSHNIVFGWMGPRGRTYMAMLSMMTSMLIIAVAIFICESYSFGWIMLAYALGGVGVGSFEANFLCCLTPLGPQTKHVAITAIPVGITAVLVGAFFAMGPPFYVSATSIYLVVAGSVVCAMVLFAFRIPDRKLAATETESQGLRRFITEVQHWRERLPLVWHLPLATAIDVFCLATFSPGVALYIYDAKTLTLLPGLSMPNPDFFAIFNVFNMLGGLCGRILSYRVKPHHPLLYTVFSVAGATVLLLKIPILAPMSTFLVMVGDGLIYGTIARRIDATVPKQFNLVALSFWLFIGDFGSVLGSNLISYIRVWVVGH